MNFAISDYDLDNVLTEQLALESAAADAGAATTSEGNARADASASQFDAADPLGTEEAEPLESPAKRQRLEDKAADGGDAFSPSAADEQAASGAAASNGTGVSPGDTAAPMVTARPDHPHSWLERPSVPTSNGSAPCDDSNLTSDAAAQSLYAEISSRQQQQQLQCSDQPGPSCAAKEVPCAATPSIQGPCEPSGGMPVPMDAGDGSYPVGVSHSADAHGQMDIYGVGANEAMNAPDIQQVEQSEYQVGCFRDFNVMQLIWTLPFVMGDFFTLFASSPMVQRGKRKVSFAACQIYSVKRTGAGAVKRYMAISSTVVKPHHWKKRNLLRW